MKELKGRKFKYKNHRGTSDWVDVIKDIRLTYHYVGIGMIKPNIFVVGERNGFSYEIENVVILYDPIDAHPLLQLADLKKQKEITNKSI